MKIAMICSIDSWGGLEQNTVKTSVWLKESGVDISIIAQEGTRVAQHAQTQGLPVLFFAQKGKHKVWGQARKLKQILEQNKIDILVIAHWRHLYLSVWAKYFMAGKLKVVYWQHMQMAVSRRDFYHASFYRRVDKWITPLSYLREELKRNTTLKDNQIIQIPQVIDTQHFLNVQERRQEARAKFGISPDAFVVGTIGRIDSQKGQEFLVRAMKILADKNLPIIAIVMGSNNAEDYQGFLQRLAGELQIETKIRFLPFADDVREGFALLDVFAMCSLSEPIGMVTIEAMTAGIPVVGTDTGGTPELLEQGEAGWLFPAQNSEALAGTIEKIYKNPEIVQKIAIQARQVALQKYDKQLQIRAFQELFKKL